MSEIKATLSRLEAQRTQATTLKRSLDEYDNVIRTQNNLNLPCHAFFTANAVLDPITGAALEYPKLKLGDNAKAWIRGCSNEIGRLARGVHPQMMTGSNTIHFIHPSQKPPDRTATYLRIVANYRPQKEDPFRVRFTVGGNRIDYPGNVATPTAELATVKLHLNSVISDVKASYMTVDIKDYYLGTPMNRFEYMRIPVKHIPDDIMHQYNLAGLIVNDHVLVEIRKVMYGLPQAGLIAQEILNIHLAASSYTPSRHTPGLYTHNKRKTTFTLVVDDFGIKYHHKHDALHLLEVLKQKYTITTDWKGELYIGISLKWNYKKRIVDLSMPGYIDRALTRFLHITPTRSQHSPFAAPLPVFGQAQQLTPSPDLSKPLPPTGIKHVQEIIGVLLYQARALNSPLLAALNTLGTAQAAATENTIIALTQLLDYCATYPNPILRFVASDMVLRIHSDASYLSVPKARSRAAGYFYLSSNTDEPPINGAVHVLCVVLKNVMASAAEAETGAVFKSCQAAVSLRETLTEMGHPQPATPVHVDNACAVGILNETFRQRRSKSMDMRFYWVRDRIRQNQFRIFWEKGSSNLADYFTKHFPPSHHRKMRSTYLLNSIIFLDTLERVT